MTTRTAKHGPARVRSLLAAAATATLVGIAFSVAGDPALGAWVTLAGISLLIYGLHRFGRGGPDR